MDDLAQQLGQQLDDLDRDLDREIAKRLKDCDPDLAKVARMAKRVWEKITGDRDAVIREEHDWLFAFDLVIAQKTTWMNHARAGGPVTELTVDDAMAWIIGCALTTGRFWVQDKARRWVARSTPFSSWEGRAGEKEDDKDGIPGPILEVSVSGIDEVLSASLPLTTIIRWVLGGCAREVHVFRFSASQASVMGVAGYAAEGWMTGKRAELAEIAQDIADKSGGVLDQARVMRLWGETRRRLGEVLYMLGGLGPIGALKTTGTLHSTAVCVDECYRGRWKGNTITVLKLASRVASPTDEGAEVKGAALLALVQRPTPGAEAKKLCSVLRERGFDVSQDAVAGLRDAEQEFRGALQDCGSRPEETGGSR